MEAKPIITRMPPSPTGHLHIGTARTALFNYLFAKHHGGQMILRIEDTDKERSKKVYEEEIVAGLEWLGLTWDNTTIYRQSERTERYRECLMQVIESGAAYISKEASQKNPDETIEVVRLKNPNKSITFTDLVRGDITFDTTELGDIVIARSIDDALYHFTVVVDDMDMNISHVLRGEDHISNTPRQILIQEAIGAERPAYAHMPLILAPDRSKMSKRHGAVALDDYIKQGFTKDAIINYLALLGWSPGTDQEIFSLDQLIKDFDLSGMQKSGAIFNLDKFKWVNKQYLDTLTHESYRSYVETALPEIITELPGYTQTTLDRLIPSIRERAQTGSDITAAAEAGEYNFAFSTPNYETSLLQWKKDDTITDALPRLQKAHELLSFADFTSPDTIKAVLWDYAEEIGKGEVLWPLRVALSGLERSPDPFTCAHIIQKKETLARIKQACDKITSNAT